MLHCVLKNSTFANIDMCNKFPPSLYNELQLLRFTYDQTGHKGTYDSVLDPIEKRLIELYLETNSYLDIALQYDRDELNIYFIIRNAMIKLKLMTVFNNGRA